MATYASAAAIVAASLAIGGSVCVSQGWSWLSPAVGLAAAICVARLGSQLPGHGTTGAVLLALLVAGAVITLRRKIGLGALLFGLAPGAVVIGLCSLPFLLNRRIGVLGESVDDDASIHMAWADALRSAGDAVHLGSRGYPLGPHALMAALAEALGTGVDAALGGLLLAVPVLTALTALA